MPKTHLNHTQNTILTQQVRMWECYHSNEHINTLSLINAMTKPIEIHGHISTTDKRDLTFHFERAYGCDSNI